MKRIEFVILSCIVLFDFTTKIMANYYLPFENDVTILANKISLYLTYNLGATGVKADDLLDGEYNKNLTIILSSLYTILSLIYFLYIRKRHVKVIYKIIIGIVLFTILIFLVETAKVQFSDFAISSWTASVIGKIAGIFLYGTLFFF